MGGGRMTWSKYGSEFWDDLADAGLSDAAARTHAEGIGWLYRIERTDLRIPKQLVRRFAGSTRWAEAAQELVVTGLWVDTGDAYSVVHHADVIRASIGAQRRKRERDKKAQTAWRKRITNTTGISGGVSDGVGSDVSAYPDSQTDSQEVGRTKEQTNGWLEKARPPGSGIPAAALSDRIQQRTDAGYDR